MKPALALCALAALAPVLATPATARNGSLIGAVASAARHAGEEDGGVAAVEGLVSAADPQGMQAALQELGYRAELDQDGEGDPMIRSSAAGSNFSIYFYGCVDHAGCDSILFTAGFDLSEPMSPEQANDWNRDALLATIYLDDEGDPHLFHYVLTRGGLPGDVFAASLREWAQVLGDFRGHIGW
ncbi:YbjN domain-containing protein [Mangrovicoccus algicola]|uniref:YbjN domain-containing protein n=1 Tax=Mangrovicoccus algicola TaxID=2771008 RepID=A0A8J7CX28_9RHOB|nr:YbjN domain-containing protein [Mangrovicoccus algicola]MBE3640094.1 YbjN domain-containing protein [Mangrovicoccus algicola]